MILVARGLASNLLRTNAANDMAFSQSVDGDTARVPHTQLPCARCCWPDLPVQPIWKCCQVARLLWGLSVGKGTGHAARCCLATGRLGCCLPHLGHCSGARMSWLIASKSMSMLPRACSSPSMSDSVRKTDEQKLRQWFGFFMWLPA